MRHTGSLMRLRLGACLRPRWQFVGPCVTETDKLLALIASTILTALVVHRYADLPQVSIPTIKMVKGTGGGIPTD